MPPNISSPFADEAALEGGLADFDADPFASPFWDGFADDARLGDSILRALSTAFSPGKQRKTIISIVPTLR